MSDNRFPEPHPLNDVAEFHSTFHLPILDTPQIPGADRCALRVNLLQEELDELKEAIEAKDITAVADALSDIQYVLSGAILEFGLAPKFKELFEEVQRSNMSKVCADMETA
ncbi:MAG TPA: nucleoside triphosphate pyrophosphohydrolase family protein, partial [Saprospiraceae bacterium]|nr:nucleoside triphosphate pyrophosphohydrolase family protein [Saprospiraceae bacterium]